MPRPSAEVRLTNRTRRGELAPAGKPYFRHIGEGLHLGYRRPATEGRAGAWVGRRRRADGGYKTENLGLADDLPGIVAGPQPNGSTVLTYDQAQSALRAWARAEAEAERAAQEGSTGGPTVRTAIAAYLAERESRSATSTDARLRLSCHVLHAPLADVTLRTLTEKHFADWRTGLARGGRQKKGAPSSTLAPATVARLLNDLRAALNSAAKRHRLDLAPVIRTGLKAPPNADAPRDTQILPDADIRRVVDAARAVDQDFGLLVMVLAATGARFDQLARATVSAFQPDQERLMVPVSRKGRGTKKKPAQPVPLPPDVVAALRAAVAGRRGTEPLLTRWNNRRVSPTEGNGFMTWQRDGRRRWKNSSELTRPWRAALEASGLAASFVPYALRHSSIVRALKANVPVRIVAAAHDTSIDMIEKHYAAHILDASEEIMRRALLPMTGEPVATLKVAQSA